MKKLFIIPIIIISILSYFYFNNSHHTCNWKHCIANEEYEKYTDEWCIKDIHKQNPKKSYQECEDILFLKETN